MLINVIPRVIEKHKLARDLSICSQIVHLAGEFHNSLLCSRQIDSIRFVIAEQVENNAVSPELLLEEFV